MSSANNIRIRDGRKADVETLVAIHQESFPNYWNIDAFNGFFAESAALVLIAENPAPAAMMVLRILPDEAEIMTIATRPADRRKGLAKALLVEAMNRARKAGAKRMFLDVEDANRPALSLYAAYGFEQINRRKQYYRQKDGTYTDALVMKCKLA